MGRSFLDWMKGIYKPSSPMADLYSISFEIRSNSQMPSSPVLPKTPASPQPRRQAKDILKSEFF